MVKNKTCDTLLFLFFLCLSLHQPLFFALLHYTYLFFNFRLKACSFIFFCVWLHRVNLVTLLEALHSFVSRSILNFKQCSSHVTWREHCSSLKTFMPKSKLTGALAKLWRRVVCIWRDKRWESIYSGNYFMLCTFQMRYGSDCCLKWNFLIIILWGIFR